MGNRTLLTKRVSFSASHRYWNKNWSEQKNLEIFGKAAGSLGHGHNYVLETTVKGDVDPETGMIINLYDLKPIVLEVLTDFDHKYLNEDNPYFHNLIPTTENISKVLWDLLENKLSSCQNCKLYRVRLYETPEIYVDYWEEN